jgi:hypothetical protein
MTNFLFCLKKHYTNVIKLYLTFFKISKFFKLLTYFSMY